MYNETKKYYQFKYLIYVYYFTCICIWKYYNTYTNTHQLIYQNRHFHICFQQYQYKLISDWIQISLQIVTSVKYSVKTNFGKMRSESFRSEL